MPFHISSIRESLACAQDSRHSFSRLFKALVGNALGGYVRDRRPTQAVRLLLGTDLGIIDMAFRVGFSSHEAFTRSFKLCHSDNSPVAVICSSLINETQTSGVAALCDFGRPILNSKLYSGIYGYSRQDGNHYGRFVRHRSGNSQADGKSWCPGSPGRSLPG